MSKSEKVDPTVLNSGIPKLRKKLNNTTNELSDAAGKKPTIGLGLDEDLASHRGTGAITYLRGGWQQANLTKVDWGRASMDTYYFKDSFKDAAKNAGWINFNVSNFKVSYPKPGITNFEFEHIINNTSLLKKTTFIENGIEVFWNGAKFTK